MFIALVVAAVLLAAMCASSASLKLRKDERSVAAIGGTGGVPLRLFPVLAALELAGAAGILIGLWLEPLGVAAAGLAVYFLGAVVGHLRVGDTEASRCRCRPSCSPSPCSPSGLRPCDAGRPSTHPNVASCGVFAATLNHRRFPKGRTHGYLHRQDRFRGRSPGFSVRGPA